MFIPPLVVYVCGWLLGIVIAPHVPLPMWAWFLLSGLGVVGAVVTRRHNTWRNLAIAGTLLGLGAARWVLAQPALDDTFIATYNSPDGRPFAATIEGAIVDEADVRDTYVNLRVEADTLLLEGAEAGIPVHGLVLVQVPRYPEINYGDRVRAHGDLQTPPEFEDFSYKDYLARQGIYSILRRASATLLGNQPPEADTPVTCLDRWARATNAPAPSSNIWLNLQVAFFRPIYTVKSCALDAITRTFPEPQGALVSGILLGVDSGVPQSLQEAFRATGTSHILAISGEM